jgi:hypothetical protein
MLLGCAADLLISGQSMFPRLDAMRFVGFGDKDPACDLAWSASDHSAFWGGRNDTSLLEAQAMVMTGWEPS